MEKCFAAAVSYLPEYAPFHEKTHLIQLALDSNHCNGCGELTNENGMKRLNPEFVETVIEKVNKSPFYQLTAMQIQKLGWGECRMHLAVLEKHHQPYGMAHGGILASLIDSAVYWAVFTRINDGYKMISIDLKLNYLAPASEGDLWVVGKCIKAGKTLCMGEALITGQNEKLICHGTSTMMVLKNLEIQGEFELPAKFL